MSDKESGKGISSLWWLAIGFVSVISASTSIFFSEYDAIREMATSAFGGAIIGGLILFYEQFREERRELLQYERDIAQAKRLQDGANRGADIRSAADTLLKELKPLYNKYFAHVFHGAINLNKQRMDCKDYNEIRLDLLPLVNRCRYLVQRVNDEKLSGHWEIFEKDVVNRRNYVADIRNSEESTWDKAKLDADQIAADQSLKDLLNLSEKILAES